MSSAALPNPSNSVITAFPGRQDVRPAVNSLLQHPDDNIRRIALATKTHQEHIDSVGASVNSLVSYLNQSVTAAVQTQTWQILSISGSNIVSINAAASGVFKLILNQAAQITIAAPVWSPTFNPLGALGVVPPFGTTITIFIFQDSTGNRPNPIWANTTPYGFGTDVQAPFIAGIPSTRSMYELTYMDDSLWHLKNFRTGDSVT